MLIDLNDFEAGLHSKLYVSWMDVGFARSCASHLIKKGWHVKPWERRGSTYFQQAAFTSALVTSYARPFTRSRGWPKLPLELGSIYDRNEIAFHDQLINLRNQVYAHSDSVSYSIRPWKTDDFSTVIVNAPALRLSAEEAALFITMAEKLLDRIKFLRDEMDVFAEKNLD